jgi:hypothetical protein
MPNRQDGQGLINIWPCIINEEIEMSKLLENIGIPALKFKRCQVRLSQGTIVSSQSNGVTVSDDNLFSTYSSPSFASYVKDGNYIIDTKNTNSSQWPKDKSMSLFSSEVKPPSYKKVDLNDNPPDFDAWIKILTPVIHDIDQLGENGIYLPTDSLNLVFVAKGSPWHSGGDLPFEVRIFGFDFASKISHLDLNNRTPLSFSRVLSMLKKSYRIYHF